MNAKGELMVLCCLAGIWSHEERFGEWDVKLINKDMQGFDFLVIRDWALGAGKNHLPPKTDQKAFHLGQYHPPKCLNFHHGCGEKEPTQWDGLLRLEGWFPYAIFMFAEPWHQQFHYLGKGLAKAHQDRGVQISTPCPGLGTQEILQPVVDVIWN